ncbi:hypothetical protein GCM10023080_029860 [Streptomyces pseudoechinosporeus]
MRLGPAAEPALRTEGDHVRRYGKVTGSSRLEAIRGAGQELFQRVSATGPHLMDVLRLGKSLAGFGSLGEDIALNDGDVREFR